MAAIMERIAGRRRVSSSAGRAFISYETQKPSLLIDIEAKMQAGKGAGYERWAKLHKEMLP